MIIRTDIKLVILGEYGKHKNNNAKIRMERNDDDVMINKNKIKKCCRSEHYWYWKNAKKEYMFWYGRKLHRKIKNGLDLLFGKDIYGIKVNEKIAVKILTRGDIRK